MRSNDANTLNTPERYSRTFRAQRQQVQNTGRRLGDRDLNVRKRRRRNRIEGSNLLALTSGITTAYLRRQKVSPHRLPAMIEAVHSALRDLGRPVPDSRPQTAEPAVPVGQSITPDYLICLEDGVKRKALTRYIKRRYGLTPEQYRAKWELPPTYPMSAPKSARRYRKAGLSRGQGMETDWMPKSSGTIQAFEPSPVLHQ